jgi:hypothetical protein
MDAQDIAEALQERIGFEALSVQDTGTYVRILGRVPKHRTSDAVAVIRKLYRAAYKAPWGVDPSKPYFPRDPDRPDEDTVFAWRFIFQTQEMERLPFEQIVTAIKQVNAVPSAGPPLLDGSEIPLGKVGQDRNKPRRGKGAAPMGQALVGPAANLRRND